MEKTPFIPSFFILLFLCFSLSVDAREPTPAQPYMYWGQLNYVEGGWPTAVQLTITNTVTGEQLDLSSTGNMYDPASGYFKMQAGNFPSGFSPGEVIILEAEDAQGLSTTYSSPIDPSTSSEYVGILLLKDRSTSPAPPTTIRSAVTTTVLAVESTVVRPSISTTSLPVQTTSKPDSGVVCVQVVTPAVDPETAECRKFPTPCDVPAGWELVESCSEKFAVTIDEGGEVVSTVAPSTEPSCRDGVQNQDEEGVDCGGPCRKLCPESGVFSESGLYGFAMVLGLLLVVVVAVIAYLSFSGRK